MHRGGVTCADMARAFSVSFLDSAAVTFPSSVWMLARSVDVALLCCSSCVLNVAAVVCTAAAHAHGSQLGAAARVQACAQGGP